MERGSLRVRLIAVWAVFLVITLQAASLGLQTLFERSITRRTLSELTLDLSLLAQALHRDSNGTVSLATTPADPLFDVAFSGRYWQISNENQSILRSPSLSDQSLPLNSSIMPSNEQSYFRLKGPNTQNLLGMVRTLTLPQAGETPLTIIATVDYAEIENAKRRFFDDLLIGLVGLASLLLLAASAHVIIGLKPLKDIHARLARVRNGELRRLEGSFPAEVMPLVAETNALLDAQDDALEAARTRARNLAHGLKTPLAVMAAQSRILRRRGDTELASQIDRQLEAMRRHVEREMARSRARGPGATHHQRIDTAVAIMHLIGAISILPRGQQLRWEMGLTTPLMLGIDGADFNELMGNLIDNAQKWARFKIKIESRISNGNAIFTVEDDGPGVAETEIGRILQWGERADTSVPGTGLGLAITSDLVAVYNGRLDVGRSALGGLVATVTLAIRQETGRNAAA
ncbi:MAG: HAMP domain-containing sensor histidine kinase [Hyphomicrobiaceae bacterium]